MDKNVVTLENITYLVKPLAEKYRVKEIYLVRMHEVKLMRVATWIFSLSVAKDLN